MRLVLIGLIGIAGCAAQVRPASNDGEIERTVGMTLDGVRLERIFQ